ncbi:MAG: recombinase family protein, partial [Clostridiales bacterium]|nr:recombinase family protein [Clostridiales bacterium]
DCMNGEIDLIITKSISRFARNTLDTLNYVRMLKDKNIAVFFEEENINTLTMDGELLLTILSSVAQQEVENISANVKKGLKMKMQRGELVGFQGCLGYDYAPETKSISVNEDEAKIVKYIFERYNAGMGCFIIAQELEKLGYKTKRGNSVWAESTVMGILKNEKYKGDIRQGKTFTVDPISKRRLDNFGEEDQFYVRNHHARIISEELFESVQAIIQRRSRSKRNTDGKRETFTRKYPFSCMLECRFCGYHLTRRSWHSGSKYHKVMWQCVTATKKGKKYCEHSKGISEEIIENAFLESYKLLCHNNKDVIDGVLKRIETSLCSGDYAKEKSKTERALAALEKKKNNLLDMRLDELIDQQTYEEKYAELTEQFNKLNDELAVYTDTESREKSVKKRLADFRNVLEHNEVLVEFDRTIFESIIDKVIVGGYDDNGNPDPSMLTFIYKTGFTNNVDASKHKPPRANHSQNVNTELCSFAENE